MSSSAAELRRQLERKDRFFATLLHELRNPLAPIANAVQLLNKRADDPPSVNNACSIIQRQLQQLTRLVDDLLDVARIARGSIQLQREPVDLADVVALAVETARPLIDLRNHQLTVAVPHPFLIVEADAARLGQAVSNLLINAARYTDPGGRISIVADRGNGMAVLRIRDNGIGILPEQLTEIFELFAQATPHSEAGRGGLGIGLSVARQLIELHGGTLTARSDGPGQGSEFTIRLPLQACRPYGSATIPMAMAVAPAQRDEVLGVTVHSAICSMHPARSAYQ